MNAKELLLECKIKLGIQSDYALAQKMEVSRARMSDYMKGKVYLSSYELTRIALILGRDPISVIAAYEAEHEKNTTKAAFWRSFLQRAVKATKTGTLPLICGFIFLTGLNGSGRDDPPTTSHNEYYVKSQNNQAPAVVSRGLRPHPIQPALTAARP